ncbi:MAG: TVP38/TMEM64 family protein [Bdellovibrio sp.]|nr:MAG: TVP38/TMEM64 family protein [Bdellovibrio sp.]
MNTKLIKLLILFLIIIAISAFFYFDGQQYLNFHYLMKQQKAFEHFYQEKPAFVLAVYFIIYVISTALSLPGATILTLAGGALFGFTTGLILVSFASTIGATLAFLTSRFLLHDIVQKKFGLYLKAINEGIKKEGAFYLFSLRLIPIFPFFVINLAMGLTPMKTRTFYWVSQLGMLAGTAVYVNAGTQLGKLAQQPDPLKGILSPQLLLSFALLGLFPLLAKKIIYFLKKSSQEPSL